MNTIFSKNLKLLREHLDLKQNFIADSLGISRSVLSYYENGKSEPTLSMLQKMSVFFNISIDNLINTPLDLSKDFLKTTINKKLSDNLVDISSATEYEALLNKLKYKRDYYLNLYNNELPLKIKELDQLINFLEKNFISEISNIDTESADEIVPNVINLEEKKKRKKITYRDINCYGNVAAGDPRCAFEVILDTFKIDSDLLSDSKEYFILKISGDSMNEIFDDEEYVLIEKTSVIYDNDLVIAIIEGEATCKKIRFYDDEVNLIPMSTNPNHKTQIYTSKEVNICGKVVGKLSDYLEKR
ncbi:MAG: XRE family transcriptional regulator [Veillonella sp.]|uniref:XRE family transcriptional regulator n=1 Tax=Veillonella sp. TaxID=1926307 RepID=UPI002903C2D5|nr:XRE family transcriptional regulator [Veillonella sp.]MDU2702393.1 XRE family transcriptional regulator [Veillonella sp.]